MNHSIPGPMVFAPILLSLLCLFGCAAAADAGEAGGVGAAELTGDWLVEEIDGKPLLSEAEVTLTFGPEGAFSGDSGVNRLRSSYRLEGGLLQLSEIMATRMAGPPELMEQESRLMAALGQARAAQVNGDGLRLLDAAGGVRVVARASSESR